MNYTVINWEEMLHIIDEDEHPIYHLDGETLQKLSTIDNTNCSACIFHLASYGVLPAPILYQIASHIQNHFPFLQIDWFTTFYYVERISYLSIAFRMKEMLEHKEPVEENRLNRFIEFEELDPVENTDTILLKIVMMNIIHYNVKIR